MSFLDSIFKTGQQAAPAVPAPQPQAPVQEQQPIQEPATPDPFETLWQPNEDTSTQQALNFNLDPEKLATIAGKIDYASAITPEIQQRLAMGGDDAVKATLEALNVVGRQTYQQNAMATSKLIEAAVASTKASMADEVKKQIRLMGLSDGITESNPALSNPAFAPIVSAAKQQIVAKFPNASQQELNKMLNQYLTKAGEAFNPELVKKANAPAGTFGNPNAEPDTDWLAFLQ